MSLFGAKRKARKIPTFEDEASDQAAAPAPGDSSISNGEF